MIPIIITALATNGIHIITVMSICLHTMPNANGISRSNRRADCRMKVAVPTETDYDDTRMITIAIVSILLRHKARKEPVTAVNSFRGSGTEPPTRPTKETKHNSSIDTTVMNDALAGRMMRVITVTKCDDVNAPFSTSVFLLCEAMKADTASSVNGSLVTKASVADMSSSKGSEAEPGTGRTKLPRGTANNKTVIIKMISRHGIAGTIVNVSRIACPLAM